MGWEVYPRIIEKGLHMQCFRIIKKGEENGF